MDFATLIGLLAAIVIIVSAILLESGILDFVNIPGLIIVLVGTVAVTLVKYRTPGECMPGADELPEGARGG